ncbi:MAG: TAT-variant-translocated molybdopterin oxidoreductase [Planctomycetaceae bacterium]|nr:TAT-variant-translocated molybdopterin oxidoreductase [Planctomycetaceae bacterium]
MSSVTSTSAAARAYWRSLDQLQQTPEFTEFLHREFPVAASEFPQGFSRRRWLQLMGASFALTGAAGCRWQSDTLASLPVRPANRVPGVPQTFATSWELGGYARPIVVTSYDGRPIKVEGNREHPDSLGATDALSQAMILHLYDPDRSTAILQQTEQPAVERSWDEFAAELEPVLAAVKASGGAGLRVLTETSSSPTRSRLQTRIASEFPQAKWVEHNAIPVRNAIAGAELAFGRALRPHLDLTAADIIVTFDDDFFGHHPAGVRLAREWADGRVPEAGPMKRLYAVESQFSLVGGVADHRLPMKSSDIPRFLDALEELVDKGLAGAPIEESHDDSYGLKFLATVAADLLAHRGKSVVSVGETQAPAVHARAYRLNSKLGNIGATLSFLPVPDPSPIAAELSTLVEELQAGKVELLLVLGGNPVYTAPAGIELAAAIRQAKWSVRLSNYVDETSLACQWHLPAAHPLECWGDGISESGRLTLQQPLIAPLFGGKSDIELLAWVLGDVDATSQSLVRQTATTLLPADRFDKEWRKLIHDGFWGKPAATLSPTLRADLNLPAATPAPTDLELVLTPSPSTYDGRFANNGWLQETPQPLSKLTWDNAALIAPATADELGLKTGSLAALHVAGQTVELPVYVLPGQAPGSIGVALGYGRTAAGHVGGLLSDGIAAVGVNVYGLRTGAETVLTKATLKGTGRQYPLSTTQDHHAIDTVGMTEIAGRIGELVREGSLGEYEAHPDFAQHKVHHPPLESLWKEPSSDGRAWGMSIDLSRCIGCNSCMVACQSENNVPVVGKEQIARGREMHWIRIDRYFKGDVNQPEIVTQPVACHHCENAPCEQVCPVAATVHSPEGLNDMAYNRCVGTRYCANNCPYKVRRFNFFDYNAKYEAANTELSRMLMNPEVTVRERGVMEKCTYCVQRIQNVKIGAKNEQRAVRDGEVVTACQQACPANAIVFGDLNDKSSRVAALHAGPRSYAMLAELNVQPRTKYLARIRNPHPWLATAAEVHGHEEAHG